MYNEIDFQNEVKQWGKSLPTNAERVYARGLFEKMLNRGDGFDIIYYCIQALHGTTIIGKDYMFMNAGNLRNEAETLLKIYNEKKERREAELRRIREASERYIKATEKIEPVVIQVKQRSTSKKRPSKEDMFAYILSTQDDRAPNTDTDLWGPDVWKDNYYTGKYVEKRKHWECDEAIYDLMTHKHMNYADAVSAYNEIAKDGREMERYIKRCSARNILNMTDEELAIMEHVNDVPEQMARWQLEADV